MAGNAGQAGEGLTEQSPDEVRVVEALDVINFEVNHMKQNTASQEKLNAGAVKAPLTVESSFVSCNVERQELFAVRPGIPAVDALNQASCILYSVRESLCEAGMQQIVISPTQAWLLHLAVESAKAVIDSVGEGLEKLA